MSLYSGIFKARYQLRGRDWIRRVDPDDRRVFVDIGLQAAEHGKRGGEALKQKYPTLTAEGKNAHLAKIGRIGAIATNIQKEIRRSARLESDMQF